ncbi:MAG: transglutaminase-like cysteine peptidase [Proteobacteria bacterium]|nr:transglutaminase-like cysteine peptidase [Pseudomonadota bacterium]
MHNPTRFFKLMVAALALFAVLPCVGGVVDFSGNLLAYVGKRFGREAPPRLLVWQKLVRDMKGGDGGAKPLTDTQTLKKVNDFFNQVPYATDQSLWGVEDYWATPVEMLGIFGGDCEDYVISKYLSLKELGIPIDRLRMTYVKAQKLGEAHMVLAYYRKPDADPLILDNLIGEVRPASMRTDLEPVYSFNDDDLWLPSGTAKKGGASQVRLWRNLLEKLEKEQKM